MTSTSARSLTQSLDKLQISQSAKVSSRKAPADSWEDEAEADHVSPTTTNGITRPLAVHDIQESPEPPPPTPSSPSVKSKATSTGSPYQTFPPYGLNGSWEAEDNGNSMGMQNRTGKDARPEKTTAAASRLIAAGIGQRPPRRSKEEREYDAAMRAQERKKRDSAREEEASKQREKEKAQRSVWED